MKLFACSFALGILAVALAGACSKQGCQAKPGQDHVMLQMSAAAKPSAKTPIPTALSSKVAMRLRHRLASDPDAIEKAAATAGAQLLPEHHAHLQSLRAAGPVLQHEAGGPTSSGEALGFFGTMAQLKQYAGDSGFYTQMADYTKAKFEHLEAYASTGRMPQEVVTSFQSRMEGISGNLLIHAGLRAACPIAMADLRPLELKEFGGNFRAENRQKLDDFRAQIMGNVQDIMSTMWTAFLDSVDGHLAWKLRSELQVMIQDVVLMPSVLSQNATGAAAGFEGQLQWMWLLMMNSDADVMIKKLLGGSKCLPPTSPAQEECQRWHKHCTVLEVLDLVMLQTELTLAIAILEPSWAGSLYDKVKAQIAEASAVIDSTAMQACKDGVAEAGQDAAAVEANIQRKLQFLHAMQIESGSATLQTSAATAAEQNAKPPVPAPALSSKVAMRLRHRLASDPDAIEKAAATAGAQLLPEHHAHLQSLRAAGPVDGLLQHEAGQSTRTDEERDCRQVLIDLALQAETDMVVPDYYEELGQTISDQLNHSVQLVKNSDWNGEDEVYSTVKAGFELGAALGVFIPVIGPILAEVCAVVAFVLNIYSAIVHQPDYDEIQEAFDNAMRSLYDQVMEGVVQVSQEMWSRMLASQDRRTAAALRHKFVVLGEELQFMPFMLMKNATGAAAGFERQMMLMWLLAINHDIEVLVTLMLGSAKCLPMLPGHPLEGECWEWHKHCTVLDVLDLLVLHSSITTGMSMLEPSWAELLQAKLQSRLAEAIPVISFAKWACMTAASDSNAVYRNIEKKLPALMKIEGSYSEYFSFPRMYADVSSSYLSSGLVQGILIQDPPSEYGLFNFFYTTASHHFHYWQPTYGTRFPSTRDGWLLPTSANQQAAYDEGMFAKKIPTSGNHECPTLSFLRSISVSPKDPLGRDPTRDRLQTDCSQPGAWTTADCARGEVSDSGNGDHCVMDAPDVITLECPPTGNWAGCPAGMYLTQFTRSPCQFKCAFLLGVGYQGPEGHVMLQESAAAKPSAKTPIPATTLSSKVAMRLRRRLASDPDAIEKAAATAGAQLLPEHHAHLQSLRAAGPVDGLLQHAAGGPTSSGEEVDSQQFLAEYMTRFAPYAGEPGFYDALGWYTKAQFQYLIASGKSEAPTDPGVITEFEERMGSVVNGMADLVLPGLSATSALNLALVPWWNSFWPGGDISTLQDDFERALTELNQNVIGNIKDLMQHWWNATLTVYDPSEARQLRDEFQFLVEHLQFMPSMLSKDLVGVGAGFEQQMVLMWLLLINHDIESVGAELLGGWRCFPVTTPAQEECITWHKQCTVLESVDLTLLHTQVTLAMATLEPSWAISLHEKMQSSLRETLQVIGDAKWACMTTAGDRSNEVYANIERKLPALLNITGSFDEYFSFQRTGVGVETNSVSPGIVQGVRIDHIDHGHTYAYHSFQYWQNVTQVLTPGCDPWVVASKDGWSVPEMMLHPTGSHCNSPTPERIEVNTEQQYVNLHVLESQLASYRCPLPSFLTTARYNKFSCSQPGAWTTANCMGASCWMLSDYYFTTAFVQQYHEEEWAGCPEGMYMTNIDLSGRYIRCRPLLGVGYPGPGPPSVVPVAR